MVVTLKLVHFPPTNDRILELSRDNPGYKFERTTNGELQVTPTGGESGRRNAALIGQLHLWNISAEGGVVFDSSTGFLLPDGSLYSPNAAWVLRARWEALTSADREQLVPLCPDVVFEIASRTDRLDDLRGKMEIDVRNGAALAILIDPYGKTVETWRPGRTSEVLRAVPQTTFGAPLNNFTLDLRHIID